MKKIILILFFAVQALVAQNLPAATPDKGEQHEFIIANFKTESGVTLPQARVVYGTYGHLNTEKNNVVLLPSHYMANFHGYEWLIGPDKVAENHCQPDRYRSCPSGQALSKRPCPGTCACGLCGHKAGFSCRIRIQPTTRGTE